MVCVFIYGIITNQDLIKTKKRRMASSLFCFVVYVLRDYFALMAAALCSSSGFLLLVLKAVCKYAFALVWSFWL